MSAFNQGYELGLRHGQELAAGRTPLTPGTVTNRHKILAAGTLASGIAGASMLALAMGTGKYRNFGIAMVFAGTVTASLLTASRVLLGQQPTPNLEIWP